MPLIESILLLLVVSRIAGEIAERYRQPSMIGEIVAGILLGPSVFALITMTPQLKAIAELGVLLLVFLAGMEIDLHDLRTAMQGRRIWIGIMGFAVPLVLGIATGWVFGFDMTRNTFLGLCIAITALPVSVRMLMDLDVLQTKMGRQIISAAVLNDVSALLVLGIIIEMQQDGGNWRSYLQSVAWILAKSLLFMAAVLLAARLIKYSSGRIPLSRQWLSRWLLQLRGKEALFAMTLLFVLMFAGASELVGLHFVVGAFFGSMLLSHQLLGAANFKEVQKTASRITMGFLGPLFFAAIGLEFNTSALSDWRLVVAVLIVAFAGKIMPLRPADRLKDIPKLMHPWEYNESSRSRASGRADNRKTEKKVAWGQESARKKRQASLPEICHHHSVERKLQRAGVSQNQRMEGAMSVSVWRYRAVTRSTPSPSVSPVFNMKEDRVPRASSKRANSPCSVCQTPQNRNPFNR